MLSISFFSPVCALLVTFLLTRLLLSKKFVRKLQDVPNDRSLHSSPVPRTGSVGLVAGILSGWMLMRDAMEWWLLLPVLGLFAISMLDDLYNLSVWQRLLAHFLAALILVGGSGLYAQQGVVIALMALLIAVWLINLYNFMDGSDGLAGGMAFFGFGMYGIAAWLAGNQSLSWMNFCIVAASAGFLFFNFHPAKIFLGDAGSIPLGFLVAAMGVWGWQQGSWAAWFPVMVFSPFIFDATITLIKRSIRGEKITQAHREHYYQRLIQLGWGHRNVALAEYMLMLVVGISSLLFLHHPFPLLVMLAWGVFYAGLMILIDARWKRFKRGADV